MNLKNTTRRAERDDPYRLPEQDIAPRRMVAEPLRPCSSIRPPRRRALLAPRTVDPPPSLSTVELGVQGLDHFVLFPQ